jgi:hypothetical protein
MESALGSGGDVAETVAPKNMICFIEKMPRLNHRTGFFSLKESLSPRPRLPA